MQLSAVALALATTFAVGASTAAEIPWDGPFNGDGCTSIIVAPGASASGAAMTTHTNDCMECDFRISKVPAKDHAEGSTRKISGYRAAYPRFLGEDWGPTYYESNTDTSIHPWVAGEGPFAPISEIPNVAHTYAYIDGGYGIMNEHQLSIGESTCGAKVTTFGIHKGGKARVDVSELSRVAMERCKTARCAIGLMGSLAEEYGYYGADETEGEGGESLQIVDTQEAWVFHILADDSGESAVWAAQRVRDGHIAAVANQFIIRELDLDNEDMFMASSNVEEVATRLGFYDPATDGKFDFTKAYAMDRKHLSTYATRRVWRVMTMAAPSSELPGDTTTFADDYPFDIKPDKLLTVKDVVAMHRDHYEGTPYDMTKGLAGGPYGDPSRFDPSGTIASAVYPPEDQISDTEAWAATPIPFERAISIYRCSYSWVSESRAHVPNELGVVWFSQYAPHASGAVPLYVSAPDIPKGFSSGSLLEFDLSVSYWAHAAVGNWADRFYVHTIGDIKTLQSELEEGLYAAQTGIETAAKEMLMAGQKAAVSTMLGDYSATASAEEIEAWSGMLWKMIAKYKDGQRIDNFHAETLKPTKLFYPKFWLQAVGYLPATESAAAPLHSAGGAWTLLSHVLVAALSITATVVFMNRKAAAGNASSSGPVVIEMATAVPSYRFKQQGYQPVL